MKERPIIFSAPMVRAILEGRKTQTRRVFKIRGVDGRQYQIDSPREEIIEFDDGTFHYKSTAGLSGPYQCPYGIPGDRLWVRETFRYDFYDPTRIIYRAEMPHSEEELKLLPWKPSIHMPRLASRIDLEVTDIRMERLQEISEKDAEAEGVNVSRETDGFAHTKRRILAYFRDLWDSIHGPGAWEQNPWVWVVEFRRAT